MRNEIQPSHITIHHSGMDLSDEAYFLNHMAGPWAEKPAVSCHSLCMKVTKKLHKSVRYVWIFFFSELASYFMLDIIVFLLFLSLPPLSSYCRWCKSVSVASDLELLKLHLKARFSNVCWARTNTSSSVLRFIFCNTNDKKNCYSSCEIELNV